MDLQKMINKGLEDMNESGKLQSIIEEKLSKMMDSIINDALSWNTDLYKNLKAEIVKKLEIPAGNIDLISFSQTAAEVVQRELNEKGLGVLTEKITEKINSFTGVLDKKEWKLSEIVEEFIKSYHFSESEGEISFHIEDTGRNNYTVSIDECENTDRYDCEYSFRFDNKKLWLVEYRGKKLSLLNNPFEATHGFGSFLFNLYANEVKIINDEAYVVTEYGYND